MPMPPSWTTGSGLVDWSYSAVPTSGPLGPPGGRTTAVLMEQALDVASCLDGFAVPAEVRFRTSSTGDRAGTRPVHGRDLRVVLAEAALDHEDLVGIGLALDLLVDLDPAAATERLPGAGSVTVSLIPRGGAHEERRIGVSLSLDVDIYAATTWGEVRDNRVLAGLNGPRLAGFLRCLDARPGITLARIESDSYCADERGFDSPRPSEIGW